MTTLAELRALVQQQTETGETELPSSTIDDYLKQGFERTVNAEVRWPFYQKTWTLTQTTGEYTISMPTDLDIPGIMSFRDTDRNVRLSYIDSEEAEDRFGGIGSANGSQPWYFTVWADTITLWPNTTYTEDKDYALRGYRLPLAFPTSSTDSPDCDSRLHDALAHYATALAYAQQEDLELENQYMRRWQQDVELARQIIMSSPQAHPLIMGPSAEHITPIGPRYRSRGSRAWTISAP